MLRLITTPAAEKDLTAQYNWYLQRADQDVAERFVTDFQKMVRKLEKQPYLGRLRQYRPVPLHGIRSISVSRTFQAHLIFYRLEPSDLVIFRVMHGARNLERRLIEH